MPEAKPTTLDELHRAVLVAKKDFADAKYEMQRARTAESIAANTLIEAQKAFDEAVASVRKEWSDK